jgi:hypothetical protein
VGQHARFTPERGAEVDVQAARHEIGKDVEQRPAHHVGGRHAAVLLEVSVPAPDRQREVGGEDALLRELGEPPQHRGGQDVRSRRG